MSLLPFGFMPRSMFDMDLWFRHPRLGFGPSTLDLFDPFDELDQMMSRNLMWLHRPDFMRPLIDFPRFPHKYRVTVDCNGFNPKSIKTDIKGNKVTVSAHEEEKFNTDNYSVKEFRKTYELPLHAELDKLASFVTGNGQLVIETPLRNSLLGSSFNDDLFPKVSDDGKSLAMNITLPDNVDPSKINVTCKDRDIIIKAEDKKESQDRMSHFSYYKRSTLPENTDFNSVKCTLDKNKINVTASLLSDFKPNSRTIPIENTKSF